MFLLDRLTRINPIAEVFDREGVIGLRREHSLNYLLDSSWPFAHKCFLTTPCAGRKTLIHKFGTYAEAVRSEQRLRHAVAARGREHHQRAPLLGSQVHRRVAGNLSRRSISSGVGA